MPKGTVKRTHYSQRVILFSGGQTSAYMTILLKPQFNDIILFTDTGREHPATYKFIALFEANEGLKVNRITNKETFQELCTRKKAVPNLTQRFCTQELKIRAAKRWLRENGIQRFTQFIGFRSDEKQRIEGHKERNVKVSTKFPLHEWNINKAMVDAYWQQRPYRLEIPRILGNCDLCFMKGSNAIITILQHYPELAQRWIDDETATNRTFIKGTSYAQLLKIATSTPTLFSISEAAPAFNCSCGP